MRLSSDKLRVVNQTTLVDVAPTTLTVCGTAQMKEARNSNYANFKKRDLRKDATDILKFQLLMFYQWALTRYCVENPLRVKQIRKDAFQITVDNFDIDDAEIDKYLENPKFMWRFSVRNYEFFLTFFKSNKKSKLFYSRFDTADIDDSPLLDYIKPIKNYMKDKFKKTFTSKKVTAMKKAYDFDITLITNFMKKHFEPLNQFKTSEFLFSDDYYLHEVQPDAEYEDFICHLICGQTKNFVSPLLKWHIESNSIEKKDTLYNFKCEEIETSTSNNLQTNNISLTNYEDLSFRSYQTVKT